MMILIYALTLMATLTYLKKATPKNEAFLGMLNDKTMMRAHYIIFFAAAVLDICVSVLIVLSKSDYSEQTLTRFLAAKDILIMPENLLWACTHYLMLVVFVRYGDPIKDNRRSFIMP